MSKERDKEISLESRDEVRDETIQICKRLKVSREYIIRNFKRLSKKNLKNLSSIKERLSILSLLTFLIFKSRLRGILRRFLICTPQIGLAEVTSIILMSFLMLSVLGLPRTMIPMEKKIKQFGKKSYDFAFRPPVLDRRLNVLEGAVRSSKTWAMIPKMIQLCKYQIGGIGVISGVSKQTIYRNVLDDLFDVIGTRNYDYNRQSGELRLFDDRWQVIGAKDEGSEKYIRGATIGKWYGDELTLQPESFVKMAINRLSPPGARAYFTTNADSPFHFFKTEYLDNQELRDRGDLWSEHFTLDDNPNLSREYKEFIGRAYAGMFKLRYIDGLWVVAEGSIYRDSWNDGCLFEDMTAPPGLGVQGSYIERWIAVDYGTDHPQCYIEFLDDGKIVWIQRMYYWDSKKEMRQKTDGEYADDLEKFIGERKDAQVILPPECASFAAELTNRGVWFIDANNDVMDGIRTVSTMFCRKLVRIHKQNCMPLLREIPVYSWDAKKSLLGKEEPIKKMDDAIDCLRYGIATKINPWRLAA